MIDLTQEADDIVTRGVAVARRVKRSVFAGIDRRDLEVFTRVLTDLDARLMATVNLSRGTSRPSEGGTDV